MSNRRRRRGYKRNQPRKNLNRKYSFWGTLIASGASIIIKDLSQPNSKIRSFFNKILLPHNKRNEIKDKTENKEEITNVKYKVLP